MTKRKTPATTPRPPPDPKLARVLLIQMHGWEDMWRRLAVPGDFSLYDLHLAIQAVTLFDDGHLHQFTDKRRKCHYLSVELADDFGRLDHECKLETETPVGAVLAKRGDKLVYDYDFGDSWRFNIKVEKVLPAGGGDAERIVCLGGEKAGPIEDCGGLPGFAEILRLLKKSRPGKADKEMLEWIGDDYDPDRFDPEAANRELAKITRATCLDAGESPISPAG